MKTPNYMFDSQRQCAAALKIPLAVLKSAKASGCPAFRPGGRVDVPELMAWLFTKEAAQGANWVRMFEEFRARREKIRHDKDVGEIVAKVFVRQENQTAMAMMFTVLDRVFCSQMPADLVGRQPAEIRARCVEAIEELKTELRQAFENQAAETPAND